MFVFFGVNVFAVFLVNKGPYFINFDMLRFNVNKLAMQQVFGTLSGESENGKNRIAVNPDDASGRADATTLG